jgi:CheY-like chemotaxis protein
MKLLLVEDDQFKARRLEQVLSNVDSSIVVRLARSVTSAIRALEEDGTILLLVLDMSLPTFDVGFAESGGKPQGFGGREVMRFLVNNNIDCPVIVVTQFRGFEEAERQVDLPTLTMQLETEFRHIYRGLVYYDAASDKWREELTKLTREVFDARK